MQTNLKISVETARRLAESVNGCTHTRGNLVLVQEGQQLFCIGCGSWFPVLDDAHSAAEGDRPLRALLARAADALQKATDCPACGTPNYLSLDHHEPDCIVREIRALQGDQPAATVKPGWADALNALGTPEERQASLRWATLESTGAEGQCGAAPQQCGALYQGFRCTLPICHVGDHKAITATWPTAGEFDEPILPPSIQAGEVQHLRPEDVGLSPGPDERPAKRPLPPLLSDRETSLYAAVLDLTARINSAAVNHQVPVAVRVSILSDLVDAWHRARPVSCVVDWPELGRPEAPPETFAVIRYLRASARGRCVPADERHLELLLSTGASWELLCRGIPSLEMAETIAQALGRQPDDPTAYFDVAREALDRVRRAATAEAEKVSREAFAPIPEAYAVIRSLSDAASKGTCLVVLEAFWDEFERQNPDSAAWALVCRGVADQQSAYSIARALSSRPFSENGR